MLERAWKHIVKYYSNTYDSSVGQSNIETNKVVECPTRRFFTGKNVMGLFSLIVLLLSSYGKPFRFCRMRVWFLFSVLIEVLQAFVTP